MYLTVTFLSCNLKFHMQWTTVKRSSVLLGRLFLCLKGDLLIQVKLYYYTTFPRKQSTYILRNCIPFQSFWFKGIHFAKSSAFSVVLCRCVSCCPFSFDQCHDIVEILLELALNTNQSIFWPLYCQFFYLPFWYHKGFYYIIILAN